MIPYAVDFFLFHYCLALYLTSVLSLLLGAFIFLKGPRNTINRTYAGFTLSIAFWSFTQSLIGTWPDPSLWLPIAQVEHLGHVFIPSFFLHFIHTLTRRPVGWRVGISYLISTIFMCLIPTRLMLAGIDVHAVGKFALDGGPLYIVYVAWFIGTVTESLLKLRVTMHSKPQASRHLTYMFWGACIGYLGGLPNFLYVFDIDVYPINPFSTYLVPVYILTIAYGIIRYQMLDITVVVRKSLVYSILVTVLTVSYFGFVYMMERLFQLTFGYQSVWLSLAAFALMALAFQPLKVGIQRLVDRLFFRAPHEELMKRLERLEQEALQGENRKAVATLAAGMAHEIKNPLASIKTFAEYLPKKYDDPEFREKFSRIVGQEVGKITTMVQELLDFAKPKPPAQQPTQLSKLIDETIEFLHGSLVDKHVTVMRAYSTQDSVWVDPSQMKQVFLNLLMNSIQAMHRSGCITISTVAEDGHLAVLVTDTGPGIPRQELPKVFDPFYTTKPDGTGLGLSVVHSIVKEHGGRVVIDSDVGGGTTVRIQLPIHGGQG